MNEAAAKTIVESFGAYLRFDSEMDLYTVYFDAAWAAVKRRDFDRISEIEFRTFLSNVKQQETIIVNQYGGPTIH